MGKGQPSPALMPALCVASGCVLFGLSDWPYGYFVVLRSILCGISLFLLVGAGLTLVDWERWLLGASAVLYNPVLPVRIGEKEVWVGLNIATVVLFWFVGTRHVRQRRVWQKKRREDKVYADAYYASLASGGTKQEAYLAARKAIGRK